MMKKSLFAATAMAIALSAGSAFAADLPSRKAPVLLPPPPPPPLWTGFYVGLNAGYTWGENNTVTTAGSPAYINPAFPAGAGAVANGLAAAVSRGVNSNNDGFIGGGQIGYNHQFGNSFVAGIEADIQGVAGSGNSVSSPAVVSLGPWGFPAERYTSSVSGSKSIDYLGTVRGRLGYLITPTLLVYGTGGLAYGGVSVNSAFAASESLGPATYPTVFGATAFSDTRVGWTAGGGLEWLFLPNWSAKVEYLYYDLGSVTTNTVVSQINVGAGVWGAAAVQTHADFKGHIVRAGVNYHFNLFNPAPVPVIAKY